MVLDDAAFSMVAAMVGIVLFVAPPYQPFSKAETDFDDRSGSTERTTSAQSIA